MHKLVVHYTFIKNENIDYNLYSSLCDNACLHDSKRVSGPEKNNKGMENVPNRTARMG